MKKIVSILVVGVLAAAGSKAADPKKPNWGYTDTPKLPSGWCVHDIDRPQPEVVTPGDTPCAPPSDAIVLFDGTDLSNWVGSKQDDPKKKKYNPKGEALWKVENGYMECTPTGTIKTKQKFGDCQFHIEWQTANPRQGDSQGAGNSGVFMQGRYETQVLDNFENRTYADGMAGCVYGQKPPMVNACKKPGEWQKYDIIFQAPRFEGEKLVSPAYVTVFLNGVLVQHKTEILGPTTHKKLPVYKPHGNDSIALQDHNNNTRFRNIWIRELDLMKDDSRK
ncbi:hypothetical protein PDESU_05448 [Pontiella desulfatans]|uniref:3-keto-alpha-glucoside-1,2-lyase/3-keto-2-hydroxy-glucal hydratase domain-containing protein n=1 Tax=Pontiella desulfatans TaxID=2750659 RepID=A0A6C2UC88_PONDE|nr:DUF1080 domain-containing protein [Pontiella desulfatans]VGO16856.1 hypothetical protein PDESU_05448 [Pontiella desulfatans]